MKQEPKDKFRGGATRSAASNRMDLVPGCGLLRIGRRYAMGSIAHGESNWKKGGKDFIKATINHAELHLQLLKDGKKQDDHLAAIGWAAVALIWFQENRPKEYAAALRELH